MRYISLSIIALFLMACSSNVSNKNKQNTDMAETSAQHKDVVSKVISVDDFEEQIKNDSSILVLDVRTREEVLQGYIENSVNIDFYDKQFEARLGELNKEVPTYVYCRSGGRSAKTAAIMKALGFKEVYDLDGGFNAWSASNKPILKD